VSIYLADFSSLYLASTVLQSMRSVDISGGFLISLPGLHGLAVDENGMTGPAQHAHKLVHDPTGHPCTIEFIIILTKLGMI
jgi:hypothetical protein